MRSFADDDETDTDSQNSQTHCEFIREAMASNRSQLVLDGLEAMKDQAEDRYFAHNGSLGGIERYAWHASVEQEFKETKAGVDAGYHYPFLRGPERGNYLVLEDLPDGAGYRVDPNLDTISAVFPSVLQLRNLTVAPPRIVRASPVLDSKNKIARKLPEEGNIYTYCKSSGSSEYTNTRVDKRMGPHSLVGSVNTEAGGTVPVYMCTAWTGPMVAAGKLRDDAEAVVKAAFPRVLAFMCHILSEHKDTGLGANGARYYHSYKEKEDNLLLCPTQHGHQDAQAFTTWSTPALQEFHRCWNDTDVINEYCTNVLTADLPLGVDVEEAVEHFKLCAQHVRFVLTAHLNRHGLDIYGGFYIPGDRQRTVLAERVACLQRVLLESRRLLDSLFVSSSTSLNSLRGPTAAGWIQQAERDTTVLLSLAVEFSVVAERQPTETGWEAFPCPAVMVESTQPLIDLSAEQNELLTKPGTYRLHYNKCQASFPRTFREQTLDDGDTVGTENHIGIIHHSNWGMMCSDKGGAGGLSARNIVVPNTHHYDTLRPHFDIDGGLAPLVDDIIAAVAAVDPEAGATAVEAAAQAAYAGPPPAGPFVAMREESRPGRAGYRRTSTTAPVPPAGSPATSSVRVTRSGRGRGTRSGRGRHAASLTPPAPAVPPRNTVNVGTLRSLVHTIGGNPVGLSVYEGGRRRELGSGGEMLSARVFKDLTAFTHGLGCTKDQKRAGADVVLSGVVKRVSQVCGVGAVAPSLRVEMTVELSPEIVNTAMVDRLMELVKETYARLLLLEPSSFTKVSPTAAIAFIWTRMAVEIKDYLYSMLDANLEVSNGVPAIWAALAAGFLGNLNYSISSWYHKHDLTELADKYLKVASCRARAANFMSYTPSLLCGLPMVKYTSSFGGVVDLHGALTSVSAVQTAVSSANSSRIPKQVEAFRGLTLPRRLLNFAIPLIFGSLKYSEHPRVVRSLLTIAVTVALARAKLPTQAKVNLQREADYKHSAMVFGRLRNFRVVGPPPVYLVGGIDAAGVVVPRDEALFKESTWEWFEAATKNHDVGFGWYKAKGAKTDFTKMSMADFVDSIVDRVVNTHRLLRDAPPEALDEDDAEGEGEERVPAAAAQQAAAARQATAAPTLPSGKRRQSVRPAAPDLDVLLPYFDFLYCHLLESREPNIEAAAKRLFKCVLLMSLPDPANGRVAALMLTPGIWKRGHLKVAKLVDEGKAREKAGAELFDWDDLYTALLEIETGLEGLPERLQWFSNVEAARGRDRCQRMLGLIWASIARSTALVDRSHTWDDPVWEPARGGDGGEAQRSQQAYYAKYAPQEDVYVGVFDENEDMSEI